MTKPLNIQVHGWRGVSHSYALVNQFQLVHWHQSANVAIEHIDMPFIMAHWQAGTNAAGFHAADLNLIQDTAQKITPQALYRIYAPFELNTPVELPTLTFAVTEFGLSTETYDQKLVNTYAEKGGLIHTPSRWSQQRLVAMGMPEEIIHVIPHAADDRYFFPMMPAVIEENRQLLGYNSDDILLFNVGTHNWNKGLDVLLTGFAKAKQLQPRLKLLLKDQRSTYLINSEQYVKQTLENIGLMQEDILSAIRILPAHLDLSQLNALYNMADAYLTPYRAEGFNLPALEAQACGTPVIATAGGATDDFLSGPNFNPINGRYIENANLKDDLQINAYIEPDLTHLIEILRNLDRKQKPQQLPDLLNWPQVCENICKLLN